MSGTLHVIAGAQFGSEGKGNVTGWITRRATDPVSVRVGGPNAGHCVIGLDGVKYALRCLPVGAVTSHEAPLVIAEGSEIDPAVLMDEIRLTEAAGFNTWERLLVDYEATVIEPGHEMAPEGRRDTGRTGKGVGGARAARLRKTARRWADWMEDCPYDDFDLHLVGAMDTAGYLRDSLRSRDVVIEGTQGYGLGTHSGYYPHVTSGDCRAIDFVAQAGLPLSAARDAQVWLVARVHPIRIAGPSGPLRGETTWEAIGVEVERTTVTQKVRRVGTWDPGLVRAAVESNGDCTVVLTFYDYIDPEAHGKTSIPLTKAIERLSDSINHRIHYAGTGPDTIAEVR